MMAIGLRDGSFVRLKLTADVWGNALQLTRRTRLDSTTKDVRAPTRVLKRLIIRGRLRLDVVLR